MPTHMRTKPNQVAILAGVVLQIVMSFGLMLSASMQAGNQILEHCGVGASGGCNALLLVDLWFRSGQSRSE